MYFCSRFEKGCRKAEIKPIEPDAGNAVVGSVSKLLRCLFSTVLNR